MKYENVSDLPQSVRESVPSDAGRAVILREVQSAMRDGLSETRAFARAWRKLSEDGYEKDAGVYIRKAEKYSPPEAARENARRAIRWREEHGDEVRGGTQVGWTRARQLASGDDLTIETVRRMAAFERHRSNSSIADEHEGTPWKDAGYVAWLLWGGDEGVDWAKRVSERVEKASGAKPLYAYRPVLNAEEIVAWAKNECGLEKTLEADDMHTTIVYSRRPVLRDQPVGHWQIVSSGGGRSLMKLGDALALVFDSPDVVEEWAMFRRYGASWDYPSYIPHITLTYSAPEDLDIDSLPPFTGDLVLGPLVYEDLESGASEKYVEKKVGLLSKLRRAILSKSIRRRVSAETTVRVIKMDEERRIVWGWASVSTVDGKPYFDVYGDHIPIGVLADASTEFMRNSRQGKQMHDGGRVSDVVHSLPLTDELKKALGIESRYEGWIVGVYVENDETWQKIKSGEYPAFSIGGEGVSRAI